MDDCKWTTRWRLVLHSWRTWCVSKKMATTLFRGWQLKSNDGISRNTVCKRRNGEHSALAWSGRSNRRASSSGAYISHTPDKAGYPLDLVKGYAIFSLLKELGDSGGVQDYVDRKIEKIAGKMTPEQIEQSKSLRESGKQPIHRFLFSPKNLATDSDFLVYL